MTEQTGSADAPTIRALVDTGASVKRIVDYACTRIETSGECRVSGVDILYSTTFGWTAVIAVDTGAKLISGCGLVHDQEPIETLVELFDHIDRSIDRYWELNKESDDGQG